LFRKALSFDDVLLVPKYSSVHSRSDVDLSLEIGTDEPMRLPVFAAPMDTIMSPEMSRILFDAGARGVMHRYCSIDDQAAVIRGVADHAEVFGAVGVTGDYYDRASALIEAGAVGICVDVAHGHHISVVEAIKRLRQSYKSVHIMAGNVATLSAFDDLAEAGASSIRVGVGGGSICSTRIMTGHGVPTFQSVLECAASESDAILIADGGIKNTGDMVKALAAGADAVMVGRMLAGTKETPGDVIRQPGKQPLKVYRGMASPEAQIEWRGKYSSNEGVSRTVPLRGSAADVMFQIDKGIRSGISYSGARNVRQLQAVAEFVEQTQAGARESSTHIDVT
jgi:IMP dehydrogenase